MSTTTATKLFLLALVGAMMSETSAFSLNGRCVAPVKEATMPRSVLYMSEEAAEEAPAEEEVPEAAEEEDQGPPEDPEITALKESIAELEATLADKKSKIQYELERCEEYSKSGYARKVADMENMKRVRSNIASTSRASATAAVLKDFLPVYDTLNTLRETYLENEFGKKYCELNLQATFATLGVTDFNVEAGDTVNNFRMKVLESELSTEHPKDTILRQVAPGLELDGNVIRAALCVSSLGAEEEPEAAEEGEEAPAE